MVGLLAFLSAAAVDAPAQPQIWTHGQITFTKADGAGWTLPENQDRITDNVWITRQDRAGIFNIKLEAEYNTINRLSPLGTEWAVGSIDDWATLMYQPFAAYALDKVGDNILTLGPSVLHLIDEDIYIAIEFTAWTSGRAGGGFSYTRTTFDPSPVEPSTWGSIKSLYR
jgi:hypothetical protein